MLKNAMFFAFSGFAIILFAPYLLPVLDQAGQQPAAEIARPAALTAARPTFARQPQTQSVAAPASQVAGYREMQIPDNGHNQYVVDGVMVRFLVDTGATMVALSPETARSLGLVDSTNAPHYMMSTANGSTAAYGVKLKSIDLGSVYMSDVDAVVSQGLGRTNLLGESFLRRLASVEQRSGRLVLRQ